MGKAFVLLGFDLRLSDKVIHLLAVALEVSLAAYLVRQLILQQVARAYCACLRTVILFKFFQLLKDVLDVVESDAFRTIEPARASCACRRYDAG